MQELNRQDVAMLRVSREVAIRASEWSTHKLGGELAVASDIAAIVASCLIIAQITLQWFRERKLSRERAGSILKPIPDTERDQAERHALVEFSTMRAVCAGVPQEEAQSCVRCVLQTLAVDDLEAFCEEEAPASTRKPET